MRVEGGGGTCTCRGEREMILISFLEYMYKSQYITKGREE